MPQGQPQLDTSIQIVTPENIAFEYRVAGPFRRLAAYSIDFVIRGAILFLAILAISIAFSGLGLWGFGLGVWMLVLFVVDWFYGGLFETFWNGQTPGKHLLRLRVLSINGQPINAWQVILRNILRAADAMPILISQSFATFQLGLFAMTMNRRFQRLGDLVCGTMVVIEEPQRLYGVAKMTEPEAIHLAGYLPANFQVSRSLAKALATYVQRRSGFQPARRAEIARHLGEPLREKFNLPPGTSHDLILCAVYYLAFIAARPGGEGGENPFLNTPRIVAPPPVQLAR